MLVFLWPILPVVIPIAIGSVLLGALGASGFTGGSPFVAALLAVLF
ncbi:MAG TPA: hypothetical protein VEG44_02870 [Candidatus Acidoferrales bacterium]|nr:hypothetical protein [Candidatus Acidoferrales bacterium]